MKCVLCHERIWFCQKSSIAGVWDAVEVFYMAHRECYREDRRKRNAGTCSSTADFINDAMGES